LRKYQNSAEKGKFCGSARNSAAREKLWALQMKHGAQVTNEKLCYTKKQLCIRDAKSCIQFIIITYLVYRYAAKKQTITQNIHSIR